MSLNLTLDMTIPGGSIHVHFTDIILAELGPAKAETLRVLVADLLAIGSDTDVVPATVAEDPPSAPTPPAVPPAAPKATTKPKKATSGRVGRPKAESGTCSHAILNAVADAGGTILAAAAVVGADHGTGTTMANKKAASNLVRDGLLTTTPRTGPTSLTPKGWAAIGRTAPAGPRTTEAPAKPDLAAVPDPPAIPDLGPIERRPFDPDRVRQQQANAL